MDGQVVLVGVALLIGVVLGRWLRGLVTRWCDRCGGPMGCVDCRRRDRGEPLAWDGSDATVSAIAHYTRVRPKDET